MPAETGRCLRVSVEYGSIEYSALSQPFGGTSEFIHAGTRLSTVAAHITFVLPKDTSAEPVAFGAMPGSNFISRNSAGVLPSNRNIISSEFSIWRKSLDNPQIFAIKKFAQPSNARP